MKNPFLFRFQPEKGVIQFFEPWHEKHEDCVVCVNQDEFSRQDSFFRFLSLTPNQRLCFPAFSFHGELKWRTSIYHKVR